MPFVKDNDDSPSPDELVPVVFARSAEEAERYRQLLEDHDIKAVVDEEGVEVHFDAGAVPGGSAHGLAVLVPEMFLEEAGEIIADREDLDKFDLDDEDDGDEDDELDLEDGEFFHVEEESPPHVIFDADDADDNAEGSDEEDSDKDFKKGFDG